MPDSTPVVYDVHIWVDALVGEDSTYPHIPAIPVSTDNPSAECLSIAFDADGFAVWSSPHILTNTARVLRELGVGDNTTEAYIAQLYEIIEDSGGFVVEPPRAAFDFRDHEDNLILDLALVAEALIVVSDDADLTPLSPWKGRLILRPHQFVQHVVHSRRTR